jgi:hypothetical protein
VVCEVITASSLSEKCHELFDRYPIVASADGSSALCAMMIMLRGVDDPRFFVLSQDLREGDPRYSLRPRGSTDAVDIGANDSAPLPEEVVQVLTRGVPIPNDGSLFGWGYAGAVTALVPVYTEAMPASPDPMYAVMPRVGTSKGQWPPFTDERPFGHWFWEHYQAEELVSLDRLIADSPDTVFWVSTKTVLGSDYCAVAQDVKSTGGCTLQRGVYIPVEAMLTGRRLPPLSDLLADRTKTDLAPRFRESACEGVSPPDG